MYRNLCKHVYILIILLYIYCGNKKLTESLFIITYTSTALSNSLSYSIEHVTLRIIKYYIIIVYKYYIYI